jgi:hypothetical protein
VAARIAARIVLPRLLERGQDETVTLTIYRGASPVHPTSGTYTLKNENGETVVSGAVSVAVDGVASYAVGGASTTGEEYSDRWLEEWALVVDGVTHRIQCDALLVRRKLYNVVTQDDLLRRHPQLVSENLPPELDDFTGQIDEAFEEFERELINKGNRPNLILSPWACRGCVLSLALSYIFRDAITNATGETDRFDKLLKEYAAEYASKFPKLTYKIDAGEDGTVSATAKAAQPVIFLSATPRAGRRGLAE